jgi:hypothetical protein
MNPERSAFLRSPLTGRIAWFQGGYYLVSGIWPLLSPGTFQAVTGVKLDFWLARTVGLLLAACGAVLLLAARGGRVTRELGLLAALQAAILAGVDLHCVTQPRTTPAYLLDAFLEAGIVAGWLLVWSRERVHRRSGG